MSEDEGRRDFRCVGRRPCCFVAHLLVRLIFEQVEDASKEAGGDLVVNWEVKKGHLDVYDVWHTFYEWAQPVYVDMQPLIESEESAYTEHYRDLQRMMRQMDEIQMDRMQTQKGEYWALWTSERILEHYQYELKSSGRPRRMRRRHQTQVTGTRLREDA